MSHLILWDIPNTITEDILRDAFGVNGNIVNIQLLFSVDKTDSGFALIDFRTKEECTAVIKKFYELQIHHLHPAIKLQQFFKIDDHNKSSNNEMVNNNTIYMRCKNIIQKYERTSYKEYAGTMLHITLYNYHPIFATKWNLDVVRLESKIISLTAYTHGISDAIEEWMNNNEVESCIEMHALSLGIIIPKCAISSKVESLINILGHFHHDFSFVVHVEVFQSILKSTKNHNLKLVICETKDIISWGDKNVMETLNEVSQEMGNDEIIHDEPVINNDETRNKLLHDKVRSDELQDNSIANTDTYCLSGPNVISQKNKDNGIYHYLTLFNNEVLNLQQNNGNKLKSSSIRSNPKLIDDRENYSKMNVLIEKSISFNEPKNQQDCNNNQKNDTGNTLHDFSQTPSSSKAIASQTVQKPVKRCSSSAENNGQSSKSKKKNGVIGSDCVLQAIKKNETEQVEKKTTNEVSICPANIILKKKQVTIYSGEWKIKHQLLIPCKNDNSNCLEKLDAMMYYSMDNLQLSNPLMNYSLSEPSINILSKSTLPNCLRRKDTINNIFIDEETSKKLIMSEKTRYKKSVNISISDGVKVQSGELSDENIHKQCLATIERIETQTLIEDVTDLIMIPEPSKSHCLKHEILVVSMVVTAMRKTSTRRKETGDIFAKLISAEILSIASLTKGINRVLRNRSEFLSYNIRLFLLADIFVPLLISNCFEFSNVMDCMFDANKTECLITFIEILNEINNLKEHVNIKEYNGAVPWSFNKWNKSKHTKSFIDFVSNTSLSLYLISNGLDQTAILILSMAMRDVMRGSKNNIYFIITSWVKANLDIHLIGHSCFTRAITIAVILVIINDNEFDGTFDDFFQTFHIMILKHYVVSKQWGSQSNIQERELHCLYGIQTVCAALKYPENMLFKLFNKLYECQIVSKESFLLWKNDEMCTSFREDHKTKSKAVSLSSSFFQLLTKGL